MKKYADISQYKTIRGIKKKCGSNKLFINLQFIAS